MMARGPLMPGTCSPNTNLSWDTSMWTAAAVVKPDTRMSDRYMTTKPTWRRPIASCKRHHKTHFNVPLCLEQSTNSVAMQQNTINKSGGDSQWGDKLSLRWGWKQRNNRLLNETLTLCWMFDRVMTLLSDLLVEQLTSSFKYTLNKCGTFTKEVPKVHKNWVKSSWMEDVLPLEFRF